MGFRVIALLSLGLIPALFLTFAQKIQTSPIFFHVAVCHGFFKFFIANKFLSA